MTFRRRRRNERTSRAVYVCSLQLLCVSGGRDNTRRVRPCRTYVGIVAFRVNGILQEYSTTAASLCLSRYETGILRRGGVFRVSEVVGQGL